MTTKSENTHGAIGGRSEVVEWKIPDFFSLIESYDIGKRFESPPFTLMGCTWNLRVYPKGKKDDECISVYLRKNDPSIARIKVNYTLGLKKENGIFEKPMTCDTFEGQHLSWGWPDFYDLDQLEDLRSVFTPSGTLTITCRAETGHKIDEIVAVNATAENPEQMEFSELELLSSEFKDLLVSERKCDITINVQGKEYRAHRNVLMTRSSVFRAMYEHQTSEDETGLLTIPDCDPDSFGDFLKYLYSGRLKEVTFETAYHLYSTSEKYDVQELKAFCTEYMKRNLNAENVCDVFTLADQFNDVELQSVAQTFFNKNYRSVLFTSEWAEMMKSNHLLANKLLKAMVTEA